LTRKRWSHKAAQAAFSDGKIPEKSPIQRFQQLTKVPIPFLPQVSPFPRKKKGKELKRGKKAKLEVKMEMEPEGRLRLIPRKLF